MKKKKQSTVMILVLIVLIVIIVSGCAHPQPIDAYHEINVYGFWNGLWHGMIIGFSFIGSLFNDNIIIYAASNTGHWYDLGFVLGIGGLASGGSRL